VKVLGVFATLCLVGLIVLGYWYGGFLTLIYLSVGATIGASATELWAAYKAKAKKE